MVNMFVVFERGTQVEFNGVIFKCTQHFISPKGKWNSYEICVYDQKLKLYAIFMTSDPTNFNAMLDVFYTLPGDKLYRLDEFNL